MSRPLAKVVSVPALIVVLVLAAYFVECTAYYSRYLDANLTLRAATRSFAPEDVLGFGFGFTWLAFALPFAGAVGWWRLSRKGRRNFGPIFAVILFTLLSVADLMLFKILERQVLAI